MTCWCCTTFWNEYQKLVGEVEIADQSKGNFQQFAESGKGRVVLHHAICGYNSWEWYRELVGGRYQRKADGEHAAATFKHGQDLVVRPVSRHPIIFGMPEIHLIDETYKGMSLSPEVNVLLRTDDPTSDGPVAWVSPYCEVAGGLYSTGARSSKS